MSAGFAAWKFGDERVSIHGATSVADTQFCGEAAVVALSYFDPRTPHP
jgi:hypothetical protein